MIIEIDVASEIPIYSQLVTQIKIGMMKGKLNPGDNLPSVRNLAGDIGINLHTVNKAYKMLVSEGLVTQEKKGYKITQENPPVISQDYLTNMKKQLENLIIDGEVFNIDLQKMLSEMTGEIRGVEQDD